MKVQDMQFLTIGNRLSKHLLSEYQYGYNYLKEGTSDIESAFAECHYLSFGEPVGYSVEVVPADSFDMINGPDFVVGAKDKDGDLEKAEMAFIYDDLDAYDDLPGNKNCVYQARVVFDGTLNPEELNSSVDLFQNTLTLLTMKNDLNAFIENNDNQPQMILGIHHKITEKYPQFSQVMMDLGFKEDSRNVEEDHLVRYHKGTNFNNIG